MPSESNLSKWAKVLIPSLLAVCLTLGAAIWNQSGIISSNKQTIEQRTLTIQEFKDTDRKLEGEITELRNTVGELKTELKLVDSTQGKVLDVVDRLSLTLGRLEVAMGKLETRLEYRE